MVNNMADDDYNIRSGAEPFLENQEDQTIDYFEKIAWKRISEQILLFCDKLFGNWLEEYERISA
jgi:hypothetical protein